MHPVPWRVGGVAAGVARLQSAIVLNRSPIRLAAALLTAALLSGCGLIPAAPRAGTAASGTGDALPEASSGEGCPKRLAIDHDDFDARYVGHTADGRQFFVTTPFEPGEQGRIFVAAYLFAADGRFLEARIDHTGAGPAPEQPATDAALEARVRELGEVTYDRIVVEPFEVRRYGITFGLVVDDEDSDMCWVEVMPGDYMAFAAPWDSGTYDT